MNLVTVLPFWLTASAAVGFLVQGPAPQQKSPPDPSKLWKILARADWPYALPELDTAGGMPQQFVVRTAKELVEAIGLNEKGEEAQRQATNALLKPLKVDAIDWNKQMLVVVTAGVHGTAGYHVNIDSIELRGMTLQVSSSLEGPKPGQTSAPILTHPAQVALVGRVGGQVVFLPLRKKVSGSQSEQHK